MTESFSGRANAVNAFNTVIETCNDAAQLCSGPANPGATENPPQTATLRNDFLSLLLLLRASTTKLSLAMKPSDPAYSAVHSPLKDTSSHLAALAHCVHLLQPSTHGTLLVREYQRIAIEVIDAVRILLTVLADPKHLENHNQYLVKTGEVHDLIDAARSPSGLSTDNVAAIRKRWLQDKGSLEDGLHEVNDMLEDESADSDAEDETDGWDELGLESAAPLSPEERERTKKSLAIIRISTLLHSRILRDVLSPSPALTASSSELDALAPCSSSLLSASDDFIASLYPPHNTESISVDLSAFLDEIIRLQGIMTSILSAHNVHIQLARLDLDDTSQKPPENAHVKWFRTCFDQILKNISLLRESLAFSP